jgi:hypothetical protein
MSINFFPKIIIFTLTSNETHHFNIIHPDIHAQIPLYFIQHDYKVHLFPFANTIMTFNKL